MKYLIFSDLEPIDCVWGQWGRWYCPTEDCLVDSNIKAIRTREKIVTEKYGGLCLGESTNAVPCRNHCKGNVSNYIIAYIIPNA